MHKIYIKHLLSLITLSIILCPHLVYGAQLVFEPASNLTGDGQAAIIEIRIDPQSKVLNAVEGVITFQGSITDQLVVETETGGSVLTLWPIQPQYSATEKAIHFTGGVPGGFNQEGLLFRLRLFSPVSGVVNIGWTSGSAYLNDGKGTAESISSKSINVNLSAQNLETVNKFSADTNPPSFDSVEIGQDQNTYNGQYFISFHANDDVSGIDRYEVKEGQTVTTLIDGVYIFKNQNRTDPVYITVYDKAGNSATATVPAVFNWQQTSIIILISIVFLILVVYLIRYVIQKKKK